MSKRYKLSIIRKHFFDVASWVDPGNTCDVIYFGDPGREVNKIGIGWSCCSQNLEAAANDGCELFISHEELLHGKNWASGIDSENTQWGRRRIMALENSGMACMRLHDTWDNYPKYGIRDAWRKFLNLNELLAERPYHRHGKNWIAEGNSLALSLIESQTLHSFATGIADKCSIFPCFQGVTVHGDLEAEIKKVATGVGCHIPSLEMIELGADVLVVTFDRAFQETIRIPLTEMNANVIALEHGVAEMPGMQSMTERLRQVFPGLKTTFYCLEPKSITIRGYE